MTWPIAVRPPPTCDVGTLVWRRDGKTHATCIVKATFAMVHGGFCVPVPPRPLSRVERPLLGIAGATPEAMIETWPALAKPEVVLWGDAVAANRDPVRAMAVRMVVWKNGPRLDKTLHAYGSRQDPRYLPSAFSALPLLWERTAKGSQAQNPAGTGEAGLASVVDPSRPREPASFTARAIGWPGRELPWAQGQTFPPSAAWEWPAGLSAEAFNAAPLDQRLDAIDGDEWIVLEGMHADLPRFATRLPRPVVAATLVDGAGRRERFPLAIDTLLIDAANLQLSLLWRGSLALASDAWSQLRVEVTFELDGSEPARIDLLTAPDVPAVSLGRGLRLGETQTNMPAAQIVPAPTRPAPVERVATAAPAIVGSPHEALPGAHSPVSPAVAPAPMLTPLVVAPPVLGAPPSAAPVAPPVVAAPVVAPPPNAAPLAAAPPATPAAIAPTASTTAVAVAARPAATAPELVVETGLRGEVRARIAAKQPLNDLALAGADLTNLDLTGALLSGLNLAGAKLTGAKLTGARLTNAKLSGADLTGADLSDADLTQADLTRATLSQATLAGAQLLDANLGAVEGRGARFDGARAQRAILAQGKWQAASFRGAELSGADLSGCELSEANLEGATLVSARFVDARATGACAKRARLSDANLAGASFIDCDLAEIDAARAVWDRTTVDGTSFEGAQLESAGFARAHLDRTRFARATLTKVSFMGVTGEGACFDGANLEGVDLRQAKLLDASFEGARLSKVNGLKATFTGANLSGADLSGASLRSAKLRSAKLGGATLKDADLRDADLEGADLRGADRQGAKLAGASLKGALESE